MRPAPTPAAAALVFALACAGCPPSGGQGGGQAAGTTEGAAEGQDLTKSLRDQAPSDGEPRRGGTFAFGRGADAVSLDPADVTDGESVKVVTNVFDGLVVYEPGTTRVQPCLATSWTTSEDGLTWTFELREGVTFHDGTPLDAAAVAFSFERQRDPAHPFHQGEFVYWHDQFSFVTKVEVAGPRTVVFRLDRPFVPFLTSLAMFTASIVSPAAFEQARAAGKDPAHHPVGTGPFRFVEWRRGEAVVLEAFDGHWAGRPHLDRLVFRVVPDNNTRLALLRKGELQAMDGVNLADVAQVVAEAGVRVLGQPGMNVAYLALNCQKAPFTDARVRRAVALALDRERIARSLYYGLATPARNPMPPTVWGHADGVAIPAPDREAAKALLAEAGFAQGLDTELWTMTNPRPYMPQPDKLAQYVKAALAQVGIRVTIVPKEWASYLQEVQGGEHPMCFLGWTGDTGDPDNFLYVLLDRENTKKGSASNYSFYTGEAVHEALVAARVERDPAARAALYAKAQEQIAADVPMVPLVHTTQIALLGPKVRGYRLYPTGDVRLRGTWLAE